MDSVERESLGDGLEHFSLQAFQFLVQRSHFLRAKGISRIALCECLACLDANVSHASMRMPRMPRCEGLACLDARLSKSLFFLVFLFCPKYVNLTVMRKERPAIEELRLSDAFMDCGAEAPLELIVKVININHPENEEFLEKCELLKGYKEFWKR